MVFFLIYVDFFSYLCKMNLVNGEPEMNFRENLFRLSDS